MTFVRQGEEEEGWGFLQSWVIHKNTVGESGKN